MAIKYYRLLQICVCVCMCMCVCVCLSVCLSVCLVSVCACEAVCMYGWPPPSTSHTMLAYQFVNLSRPSGISSLRTHSLSSFMRISVDYFLIKSTSLILHNILYLCHSIYSTGRQYEGLHANLHPGHILFYSFFFFSLFLLADMNS